MQPSRILALSAAVPLAVTAGLSAAQPGAADGHVEASGFVAAAPAPPVPADWQTFVDDTGTLSIAVPPTWTETDLEPGVTDDDSPRPWIEASDDLDQYRSSFNSNGVTFFAIPATVDFAGAFEEYSVGSCSDADPVEEEYTVGGVSGTLRATDCDSGDAVFYELLANSPVDPSVTLVLHLGLTEPDETTAQAVIGSAGFADDEDGPAAPATTAEAPGPTEAPAPAPATEPTDAPAPAPAPEPTDAPAPAPAPEPAPTAGEIPPPEVDPTGLGDDPELNALARQCYDGDMEACDDLFSAAAAGSEYRSYGHTCAGRQPGVSIEFCVDAFGAGAPATTAQPTDAPAPAPAPEPTDAPAPAPAPDPTDAQDPTAVTAIDDDMVAEAAAATTAAIDNRVNLTAEDCPVAPSETLTERYAAAGIAVESPSDNVSRGDFSFAPNEFLYCGSLSIDDAGTSFETTGPNQVFLLAMPVSTPSALTTIAGALGATEETTTPTQAPELGGQFASVCGVWEAGAADFCFVGWQSGDLLIGAFWVTPTGQVTVEPLQQFVTTIVPEAVSTLAACGPTCGQTEL